MINEVYEILTIRTDEINERASITPSSIFKDESVRNNFDHERFNRILKLSSEVKRPVEVLKCCCIQGTYYSLDDPEGLQAYKHLAKQSEAFREVVVMLFKNIKSLDEASVFSTKLSSLPENFFTRLFKGRELVKAGQNTYEKLKPAYGAEKMSDANGKKLSRDFPIISIDELYELITGADLKESPLPCPDEAMISYNTWAKSETKLKDDEDIREFVKQTKEYIEKNSKGQYEDDAQKPLQKRSWYHPNDFVKIADRIGSSSIEGLPQMSVLERGYKPKRWDVSTKDDLGRHLIGANFSIDLKLKAQDNLELIFDVMIKTGRLNKTLERYWGLIKPGEVKGKTIGDVARQDLNFEIRSNVPQFSDFRYVEDVYYKNALQYADIKTFLEGINLKAHNLGFDSYNPKEKTVKKLIYTSYLGWKQKYVDSKAKESFYSINDEKPLTPDNIHLLVKKYIDPFLDDRSEISLKYFFTELFGRVFKDIKSQIKAIKMLRESQSLNELSLLAEIQMITSDENLPSEAKEVEISKVASNFHSDKIKKLESEIKSLRRYIESRELGQQ